MRTSILFLAAVLCFCIGNKAMAQVVASGTTGACTWEITGTSGNYTLTISGNGAMADYTNSVNVPWYAYRSDIETLIILPGVTTIGDMVFEQCSGLTSVNISNSVTTIGENAFELCSSLTSVIIPNSATTIGSWAFAYCNDLTSIIIPNSVTTIGDYVFTECYSLISITIPNSVTSIGNGIFTSCSNLASVIFSESVPTIGEATFRYCSSLTSITIPNSITSIGDEAFLDCIALTSITIPSSVTTIEGWAFYGCSGLTEIYVKAQTPPSLGTNTFYNVSTTIPVHVPCGKAATYQSASGWSSFTNMIENLSPTVSLQSNDSIMGYVSIIQTNTCANNSTATIGAIPYIGYRFVQWNDGNTNNPRSITVTQDTAFTATFEAVIQYYVSVNTNDSLGLMGIVTGSGFYAENDTVIITATPNTGYTFVQWNDGDTSNSRIIAVTQDTVFTASFSAAANNSFSAVHNGQTIYYNVTSESLQTVEVTYANTSYNSYSGNVDIPSTVINGVYTYTVTAIGDYAFAYSSNLTSVTMLNSIATIGDYAFTACNSLASITLPNMVTTIGDYAFSSCFGLTTIDIPNSVTSIGMHAFSSCYSLTDIDVEAKSSFYSSIGGVLFNESQNTLLLCPVGKTGSYTIPNSVTTIREFAFESCDGLTSVIIPNSVTTIGVQAFAYCSGLTSMTIPNSVSVIGDYVFQTCSNLMSITIPGSVTAIGDYAFGYCNALTSIYVQAQTPPSIGSNAFRYVPTMIPVYIPCGKATTYQSVSGWSSFTNMIENISPTVSLQSNDITMGSASITQTNTCANNNAIIAATANTGYRFVQWSDGNTDNPRTIAVTQDTTFTAIFGTQGMFNVYLTVNDVTMGTVGGGGSYTNNTTLTIEAIPYAGYRFVQWNDGDTNNQRIITVTQDTSFTATFEAILHYVVVNVNDSTMGTVTGYGSYAENTFAVIEAIPNATYRFVQWNDGNTNNPRTITITQDTTFTATFGTGMYYVTVNTNDSLGIMGTVTGSGNYAQGDTILITATPNTGYRFVQWNDGNTSNPRTIAVTQDIAFTATFEAMVQYYVFVTTINDSIMGAMGTVTGSGMYAENDTIIITATPNTGYTFVQWNDGDTSNPRIIAVTQDTVFTANFSAASNNSFSAVHNGQTIYYNVTSESLQTVEVTYANTSYNSYSGNVDIPSTVINGVYTYTVTAIGDYAFAHSSNLTSVTMLNSIATIGDYAFTACNSLASITLPNMVTTIGDYAFSSCFGLTTIDIPNSVTSIGMHAFSSCYSLTDIDVEAKSSFYSSIGGVLFNETQNTLLLCPIGKTDSYTIPNSVTTIRESAFESCDGLTSVIIPNSVTTIGVQAFAYCSGLTSMTIPNSVSVIGDYVFQTCSNLVSITIPGSVTAIGDYAFGYCNALMSIYVQAQTPPSISSNAFRYVPTTIPVYVPCGKATTYQSASGWSSFTNMIENISPTVSLQSNDITMGSAGITQTNTCANNNAIIAATANAGYQFAQWSDGVTTNPRTIAVTQDTSFAAIFEAIMYYVAVNVNNSTMGTVTGYGNYAENTLIAIEAIPNTGYRFIQWNDGNTDNPRIITVTQDTLFMATFGVMIYYVAVHANDSIMGTVTGYGSYANGDTVTITATPNTGYRFVQWNDGNTDNPRTIAVTQDTTYTAIFGMQGMFNVYLTVNDITMGTVIGSGNYANNTTLTIEAIPNTNYRFLQWSDGDTSNPRIITVTQDTSFMAVFYSTITTIHWLSADETSVNSYGSNSSNTFAVYMEFDGNDILNYKSITKSLDTIKQIQFYLAPAHYAALTACDVIIRQGDDISTSMMAVSQTVWTSSLVGGWNFVDLSNPYVIDPQKNLYIGYQVSFTGSAFPLAVASGTNPKQGWVESWGDFSNVTETNGHVFLIKAAATTKPTPADEIALSSLDIQQYHILGDSFSIQGTVKNLGTASITSFKVSYEINGVQTVDIITGVQIAPDDSYNFTHPAKHFMDSLFVGKIVVRAFEPNNTTDMEANNTMEAEVRVYSQVAPRVVLHEIFTSSTCFPCVSGNQQLQNLFNQLDTTQWAYINYPSNFPGTGDPYFTQEVDTRGTFYDMNGIPLFIGDGTYSVHPLAYTVADFNHLASIPAIGTVTNSVAVNNKTVDLEVALTPVTNMDNPNLRFFAAIVERKTFLNEKGNGEYEFEYIMKKFMTDVNGDMIAPLSFNTLIPFNYSYTFNGNYRLPDDATSPIDHSVEHSVEDFNNLMVVYWFQDIATKEVFQAGKAKPNPINTPASYLVTLYTNNSTMGTVTGYGNYAENTLATIEAIPNAGYRFIQWNDSNTTNPRTIKVTQDTTFAAIFGIMMYDVVVNTSDLTKGTVTGNGSYAKGDTVIITATPNASYRFVQWDDGNTDNPRTIAVTQDITFTAIFVTQGMLKLYITVNDTTMGSGGDIGDYTNNSLVTFVVVPNAGYRFVQWNDGDTNNPRTITLMQDTTFMAIFEAIIHYVAVYANDSTMGSVTGSGNYAQGDTAFITAMPNTGYRFVEWNDGNADNPRTIMVMQDTTLTATFETITYYVAVNANDSTMGIVTGYGSYAENALATIEAMPNTGRRFICWNDKNTDNPRTITVTQDTTFTAIFEAITYYVAVNANDSAMGTVTGYGNYAENALATIEAIPNAGYHFIQWNDGNATNPRTITITQDTIFTATFGIITYYVTVKANDSIMGSATGSGYYAKDDSVIITAIPNACYRFVQWSDSSINNPRTIAVTQNRTFTAIFETIIHYVAVNANDSNMGSVTGSGNYAENALATIEAVPNASYRFVEWNDKNTTNPRTITVLQDTTFTAIFQTTIYAVAVNANDSTMGSATGGGNYTQGDTVFITATPNAGYQFVQWNDGNTTNPRTIIVTQNITFTAIFETIMHYVTVKANNSIMGTATGSGNYAENALTTIEAIPNAGYRFVQWSDTNTDNPRTITVLQDTTFTATFEATMYYVAVNVNDSLMGMATGYGNYAENAPATIEAIPNAGYQFICWNDKNTDNPRTVTVMQDTTFTALFEAIIHYIAVYVNDSTMGTVTGNGNYAENTLAVIEAIPYTGYQFVCWNDKNTDNPRTITVKQDTVFTAIFEVIMHYVTVKANNSSMGTVTGSGNYAENTPAVMEAIPNTGYRFVEWNDGKTDNPRTITVGQDTIFTAVFGSEGMLNVYVTVNNTIMGTVTGSGDYLNNATVVIGAIPNTNYRFVSWNDKNTDNPRTITVTQDTIFTAVFEIIRHTLSLSANDAVRGTVNGGGVYIINTTATITALPNAGYRFVGWDDSNKDTVRVITVSQDTAFVAIFGLEDMYYVYAAPSNPTMGNVIGSNDYHKRNDPVFKREYAANSVASITAIPNSGHRFIAWNDGNTDNPREFNVTGDSIFTAIFESTVGIIDKETSTISVYPNPATDNIHIVLPENVTHATFTLYDMQSKLLIRQEINSREAISVSNLATGIYIYHVRTEKQSYQGKIVKRRGE